MRKNAERPSVAERELESEQDCGRAVVCCALCGEAFVQAIDTLGVLQGFPVRGIWELEAQL